MRDLLLCVIVLFPHVFYLQYWYRTEDAHYLLLSHSDSIDSSDSPRVSHVSWFWSCLFKSADCDIFTNSLISPLCNVRYWTIIECDGAWICKLFWKGSWEISKALLFKNFRRTLLRVYQVGLQIAFCEVSEGVEIVFRYSPGFTSDDFIKMKNPFSF